MELIISSVSKIINNMTLFLPVPFLWWLIRHRKEESFFRWIGLYKPSVTVHWHVALICGLVFVLPFIFDFTVFLPSSDIEVIEQSEAFAGNAYAGLAWAAVIPAFIENLFANGLCEELFFRGFLGKRLISRIGVIKGITAQAAVFALVHNILCLLGGVEVSLSYHIYIFLMAGAFGFMAGYLNEKIFNGSIIPTIIIHGLGNFITTMNIAFNR